MLVALNVKLKVCRCLTKLAGRSGRTATPRFNLSSLDSLDSLRTSRRAGSSIDCFELLVAPDIYFNFLFSYAFWVFCALKLVCVFCPPLPYIYMLRYGYIVLLHTKTLF